MPWELSVHPYPRLGRGQSGVYSGVVGIGRGTGVDTPVLVSWVVPIGPEDWGPWCTTNFGAANSSKQSVVYDE